MTFPVGLVVEEGVGFGESLPSAGVRVTRIDGLELETSEIDDAGGRLPASGFGVALNTGELEEVEVAGGCPSLRNLERMLEASLGKTVVVVVELTELANTVTVTVLTPLGLDDDDVEEVLNDVVVLVDKPSSEPVMPPETPAALIRLRTVLSLVQSKDVPGARRSGMAKHC